MGLILTKQTYILGWNKSDSWIMEVCYNIHDITPQHYNYKLKIVKYLVIEFITRVIIYHHILQSHYFIIMCEKI